MGLILDTEVGIRMGQGVAMEPGGLAREQQGVSRALVGGAKEKVHSMMRSIVSVWGDGSKHSNIGSVGASWVGTRGGGRRSAAHARPCALC